jgi:hypothetical protein
MNLEKNTQLQELEKRKTEALVAYNRAQNLIANETRGFFDKQLLDILIMRKEYVDKLETEIKCLYSEAG